MKKAVMALMLLAGLTAVAQKGERTHRDGYRSMKDWTPEQVATLKTKKMTLALDLTTSQQDQVNVLHLENAKLRQAKMEERKAQKEAGESKKLTSDERYALANARLDRQIAQKAEMKKILTEAQYEKWQKIMYQGRKHREGKRGNSRDHGRR